MMPLPYIYSPQVPSDTAIFCRSKGLEDAKKKILSSKKIRHKIMGLVLHQELKH